MQLKKLGIGENRYFLILCVMGAFAILSSTMSKNPVLSPFTISLGTPTNLEGIVASASTIPGILVSLPAASLSDVYGRRRILLFATFVFASAPFLYLFVSVWWQLALVRFYHGFATAIFVPVAEATVAERYPKRRGERISDFNSATYVGRGLAPFLGGSILYVTSYGYHTLYLAVAVAGVTAFVIALLTVAESKTQAAAARQPMDMRKTTGFVFRGWLQVARSKGVLVVSFVQACQYYVYGVVEFYFVQYMIQVAGINPFEVGAIMGAQMISVIVSRPIMGRFSDRTSRQIPVVLGCIVSAAMLILIPFTTNLWALAPISIGYGIGFAMAISSTSPLMCDLTLPSMVGTAMGFLSTMMDVGQWLGPVLSALIVTSLTARLPYTELFAILTALLLTSAMVFYLSKTAQTANKAKEQNEICEPCKADSQGGQS